MKQPQNTNVTPNTDLNQINYDIMSYIEFDTGSTKEAEIMIVDSPEAIIKNFLIYNDIKIRKIKYAYMKDEFYMLDMIVIDKEQRDKCLNLLPYAIDNAINNLGFKDYNVAKNNLFKRFAEKAMGNEKKLKEELDAVQELEYTDKMSEEFNKQLSEVQNEVESYEEIPDKEPEIQEIKEEKSEIPTAGITQEEKKSEPVKEEKKIPRMVRTKQ